MRLVTGTWEGLELVTRTGRVYELSWGRTLKGLGEWPWYGVVGRWMQWWCTGVLICVGWCGRCGCFGGGGGFLLNSGQGVVGLIVQVDGGADPVGVSVDGIQDHG